MLRAEKSTQNMEFTGCGGRIHVDNTALIGKFIDESKLCRSASAVIVLIGRNLFWLHGLSAGGKSSSQRSVARSDRGRPA